MKSTLILSSHLRLGIPRDILLGLSSQVMCLPTHGTSPSYVVYFEYTIQFYERQVTQILFVFMAFCDISELYSNSSIQFQAPFDCAKARCQCNVAPQGQQAVSGMLDWQQAVLKQMSHTCFMLAVFLWTHLQSAVRYISVSWLEFRNYSRITFYELCITSVWKYKF